MDIRRLFRLAWRNDDTDTEVEQVAVPAGEQTAAPSDVALGHAIHVTIHEMPEPAPESTAPSSGSGAEAGVKAEAVSDITPETLSPPDDSA
jgi:hypothetical protein